VPQKKTKNACGCSFAPAPNGGAYDAFPDPVEELEGQTPSLGGKLGPTLLGSYGASIVAASALEVGVCPLNIFGKSVYKV